MITNATVNELQQALKAVNKLYKGNVIFSSLEESSCNRRSFTLKTKKHGRGSARTWSKKRTKHACWHAHGNFFVCLIEIRPDAYVQSSRHGNIRITKEGGNWKDYNIGSQMEPLMASKACDCGSGLVRLINAKEGVKDEN